MSASWQPEGYWRLDTEGGDAIEAEVVINAMGNQHTPLYPDVAGRDTFAGPSWHGTRWNHDVDLSDKHVVVVGSAACAVQVVPEVAKLAKQLTVLQRSANWIMPRGRKIYSDTQRQRFRRFPSLIKVIRRVQGLMMGQVENAATLGHKRMGQFEKVAKNYLEREITDPTLREALTPDSRYGCKRGLVSDDFYPALNRDNVTLIAEGLAEVTATGVVTENGTDIPCDVIIYCTGYRIMDFDRIAVTGIDGVDLAATLGDRPAAFKGIATPGFPNYFYAMGPNALVLNASYFRTAELNVGSIVRLLGEMRQRNVDAVEVRPERCSQYCEWMDQRFPRYSWAAPDCQSYYTNASGYPPFLFPGSFRDYTREHRSLSLDDFRVTPTSGSAAAA